MAEEEGHARPAGTPVKAPDGTTLFLAELSHEIRTPLNVILGLCHLASHTPPLSSQQRGYLEQIHTSAHTLLRLVNDNLDLSRIEAGALQPAREPLDLGALCRDLITLVRRRADEKGLFFRIQWGEDVPRHILGDPDRLKQVLVNLVDNALKFTPEGEVRLFVERIPAGLEFRVRDTGPGLDESQLATLFTPFSRPIPLREGSGLGLALSRRLVQLMGGEMEVESQPGQGSAFRFTLPAAAAQGPGAPLASALVVDGDAALAGAFASGLRPFVESVAVLPTLADAEARLASGDVPDLLFIPHGAPRLQRRQGLPARSLVYRVPARSVRRAQKAVDLGWVFDFLLVPTDSARILDLVRDAVPEALEPAAIQVRGRPRILLVEDNPVSRMVTRDLLERVGFSVVEAADGQSGLRAAMAPGDPPACILMDLELPDMDGLEATRTIRSLRGPQIPILALTARLLQDERRQCAQAGMDGFLAKPVEPDLLYRTLGHHLPEFRGPQPPRAPADQPSLRWTYLHDRLKGNPDLLRRVLSQFRREAASFRASMRDAMGHGDLAALVPLAHSLAGAAGNIGADPVCQAARRLHRMPSAANLAILEQALGRLEAELSVSEHLAPSREPVLSPSAPGDLGSLRALLERKSLDALEHLPRLREALQRSGPPGALGDLEEAVESLDFPRALALLDALSETRRTP